MIDLITFGKINSQFYYNKINQSIIHAVKDYILFQLDNNYNILFAPNQKLNQQYIGPFEITEKVELLVYKLDISKKW